MKSAVFKLKILVNALVVALLVVLVGSFNTQPASAFAGTLENGNLAYAQSEFNKGSACDYLPGFETGYDAWHFVLTTRGATFQQLSTNPAIAINLNFVFMRQDGSLFTIKSGAWVQTGKGAYTYTPVQDRIRMVQAGSVAQINGSDSGIRLSHTCPGSGVATTTASPTPTASPTASATASPSPTATATRSPSPSPTPTSSPSPSPTATTSSTGFTGTLENGNLAYAQSEFNKGEACNYLPGYESGYDAWHFVLTTRGATFKQSSTNPQVAVNLNFVFMRQDGSTFIIRSGAWVQTGKGAYTYTPVQDRIRMVQAGSFAQTNGSSSGIRLSHTCPGSGVAATTSPSPSPSPTATRSPSPTPTASPSPTATVATPSPSPSVSASPTASRTPGTIPTLRPRPNPTASAIQVFPTGTRRTLPTPSPTPQPQIPTPSPTPNPTASPSASPSATPTASPSATNNATPSPSASPTLEPPVVPTPPPVEDPKKVEFIEPEKPKNINPQTFPEPPASPIVITEPPKYGTLEVNNNGTFTYTPTPQPKPVVDVIEFSYTNLAGATVVVRKEYVVIEKGDVPSIIQTGPTTSSGFALFAIPALLVSLLALSRRRFHG